MVSSNQKRDREEIQIQSMQRSWNLVIGTPRTRLVLTTASRAKCPFSSPLISMEAKPSLWLSVGEEGQDIAGKLVPGLRRIKDLGREFLIEQHSVGTEGPPPALSAFVEELGTKKKAFDDPDLRTRVLQALPTSLEAQQDALDVILDHLTSRPDLYVINRDNRDNSQGSIQVLPTGELHQIMDFAHCPLELAARIVQEDLIVMQPAKVNGEILHIMSAAAVCFSFSGIKAKLGKSLSFLHAPVPGFDKQLLPLVERTFTLPGLSPSSLGLWRTNWGFSDHSRLDPREVAYGHHTEFSKKEAIDLIPEELFLKVEYQTLRRLPRTKAILFTVRTFVESLDKATGAVGTDGEGQRVASSLHHSLSGMNENMRGYKGLHKEGSAEKVLEFLRLRTKGAG